MKGFHFHSLTLGYRRINIFACTPEPPFFRRKMKTWYLLLWITVHAVLVDAQIPAVESITIGSDLSTARQCVSYCIAGNYGNLAGCSVNSCYCAPYLRSTINSDVSLCVTGEGGCPDSSDVEAATSVISSYCDKYYAAVGATPSAVPTSAIQDTSINGELDGKFIVRSSIALIIA